MILCISHRISLRKVLCSSHWKPKVSPLFVISFRKQSFPCSRFRQFRNTSSMTPSIPKSQVALQIQEHGDVNVLEVREGVPVPELGPDEVLVKAEYAG